MSRSVGKPHSFPYSVKGSARPLRLSPARIRPSIRRSLMSSSTYLLYAQTTGHVLAAATTAAPPPQHPKPEALAGALLPVRYTPENEVLVPADQLSVLSVDSQSVPIRDALEFFVNSQNTPQP